MIFNRQLKVLDYVDLFTRNYFENKRERTFGMIKPDAIKNMGLII